MNITNFYLMIIVAISNKLSNDPSQHMGDCLISESDKSNFKPLLVHWKQWEIHLRWTLLKLMTLTGSFCLAAYFFLNLCLYMPKYASAATTNIDTMKAELDKNPENLKMRHSLAQLYFDKENFQSTVDLLKVKAEKLPQESLALLAQAYQKLNDSINEGKFLEQLTTNYPKFAEGFVLFGEYNYKKTLEKMEPKSSGAALAAFKSAIEIDPNFRPAYDGLLKAYEKYNNTYELRILLEDMLKRFGKNPQILSNLCRRNTIDGYFVNARKLCLDAISADNKNPENYIYLSLVENNEGEILKANNLLKKITTEFPQSESAASNFADFLIQQKNLPGAEAMFRQASQADANSFRAQIGLALVSFELKHYESALNAYKNACGLNPHQTSRHLKRSADLLRHRRENTLETHYTNLMNKCLTERESARTPASLAILKQEFRSAFALYSKNKNISLGQ